MIRSHAADGFSLAEVLVALSLLVMVALGMLELIVRAAASVRAARQHTLATTLAIDRLEQLLGLTFGLGDGGSPVLVEDTTTNLAGSAPTSGGAGLSVAPGATMDSNVTGWSDGADVHGRWVSQDAAASGVRFVRRWRVSASAGGGQARVFEVAVFAAGDAMRGHEIAHLVAIKAPLAY